MAETPAQLRRRLHMAQPKCYVCKQRMPRTHHEYALLCPVCGELNALKRRQTADLRGRVAVVTGVRIGIGHAVALKLLRDGASVIGTSRFPHDAAHRFATQPDFEVWGSRLSLLGLDLIDTRAVKRFADHAVANWPSLDILVNNAAQTIHRPAAFYRHLQGEEQKSVEELPSGIRPIVENAYGWLGNAILEASQRRELPSISGVPQALLETAETGDIPIDHFPAGQLTADGQQQDLRAVNSWSLRDEDIPLDEMLTVHAVNAIAPSVLCSGLKRLMRSSSQSDRFIVNVSSMEGIFNDGDKSGRHPHTNMAKAALNMFTATVAGDYRRDRIWINCVDPGWVSFQHAHPAQEAMRERGDPPLSMEDAAARICDPVYLAINGERPIFGRMLKDYRVISW